VTFHQHGGGHDHHRKGKAGNAESASDATVKP
jgi:hypothetical protein